MLASKVPFLYAHYWSTSALYLYYFMHDKGIPYLIWHIIWCLYGPFLLMSKGERFGWIEINLTCWMEVHINVKGGVCRHCSVGIDVNKLEMLLVICMCDECLVMYVHLMTFFVGNDVNTIMTRPCGGDFKMDSHVIVYVVVVVGFYFCYGYSCYVDDICCCCR